MPRVKLLCQGPKLISPKERAATSASRFDSKPMSKEQIDERLRLLFSNQQTKRNYNKRGRR